MASPPKASASRDRRPTLVVGFDFGTHSTKILLRMRGEKKAYCIQPAESTEGYPSFAFPSLVRLFEGNLYFGDKAASGAGGRLFRSLKVRLLTAQQPERLSADILVAAYLAWLFGKLRNFVNRQFGDADIRINLAAPMDHLEIIELKDRYLRIVNAAWTIVLDECSTDIRQGVNLAKARHKIEPLLAAAVPDREERLYDVLPETIAPVVSMSLDPRMSPGYYMVIDMGAGTTEASICWVGTVGTADLVTCYHDETRMIGVNDFDVADALDGYDHVNAVNELHRELTSMHRRVWASGYKKDAPNHLTRKRWKELKVVLAGGGTVRSDVYESISETNPIYPWLPAETLYKVQRHRPTDLVGIDELEGDAGMLAVAHGLTLERMKWPIWFAPGEVETQQISEVVAKPDAYWYVAGK